MELNKRSWKDINLKEYRKICEILKRDLDSELEKDIAILAVLLNTSEDSLYNINILELKRLLTEISWIKTENYTYSNKISKLKNLIIDNQEYEISMNLNSFTVAQYMDFQNFWDKRNERMGNLLAVFIIPKNHKYNEGYDIIALADRLEEVFTLDDWNNVCFFFLKTYRNLIKASILYSVWKLKKMMIITNNKEKKKFLKEKLKELQQQTNNLL